MNKLTNVQFDLIREALNRLSTNPYAMPTEFSDKALKFGMIEETYGIIQNMQIELLKEEL